MVRPHRGHKVARICSKGGGRMWEYRYENGNNNSAWICIQRPVLYSVFVPLQEKKRWQRCCFSIHYENRPKHRYLCFELDVKNNWVFALFLRHRHRNVSQIEVFSSLLSPPVSKANQPKPPTKGIKKRCFGPISRIFSTCDPPLKDEHVWLYFCHRSSNSKIAFNRKVLSNWTQFSFFLCHNHCHKVLGQNDAAACLDPKILETIVFYWLAMHFTCIK